MANERWPISKGPISLSADRASARETPAAVPPPRREEATSANAMAGFVIPSSFVIPSFVIHDPPARSG